MNSLKWIFLLFLCSHLLCAEETALSFDFFQLEGLVEDENAPVPSQRIHIRGFLYQTQDGEVVLAREPDLKTCCVGSESKRQTQLLVVGDVRDKVGQKLAMDLEGTLSHHTSHVFPYHLENTTVLPPQPFAADVVLLGSVVLVLIMASFFIWIRHGG
jgi:hypothetical protein